MRHCDVKGRHNNKERALRCYLEPGRGDRGFSDGMSRSVFFSGERKPSHREKHIFTVENGKGESIAPHSPCQSILWDTKCPSHTWRCKAGEGDTILTGGNLHDDIYNKEMEEAEVWGWKSKQRGLNGSTVRKGAASTS